MVPLKRNGIHYLKKYHLISSLVGLFFLDSNKIDKAYTENKSPFEIAMMFEGIVSKRAQKYQNVPDFNTFKEDFIQSALLEKNEIHLIWPSKVITKL